MSNILKTYKSIPGWKDTNKDGLIVTAIVPAAKWGRGVQFTIGHEFVCLSELQIWDLVKTLLKRLDLKEGYAATDPDLDEVVYPIAIQSEQGE